MNDGKFKGPYYRPTPGKIAPFQELIIRRLRRRAKAVAAQGEIRADSLPCRCEIIPVLSCFRIAR